MQSDKNAAFKNELGLTHPRLPAPPNCNTYFTISKYFPVRNQSKLQCFKGIPGNSRKGIKISASEEFWSNAHSLLRAPCPCMMMVTIDLSYQILKNIDVVFNILAGV